MKKQSCSRRNTSTQVIAPLVAIPSERLGHPAESRHPTPTTAQSAHQFGGSAVGILGPPNTRRGQRKKKGRFACSLQPRYEEEAHRRAEMTSWSAYAWQLRIIGKEVATFPSSSCLKDQVPKVPREEEKYTTAINSKKAKAIVRGESFEGQTRPKFNKRKSVATPDGSIALKGIFDLGP